jgi:hypothetical protein
LVYDLKTCHSNKLRENELISIDAEKYLTKFSGAFGEN